jgi:single-stranded-DNA-specific exonuclease
MAAAVETIHAAITAGKRICVHGDYDVDGICATALALTCLRALGAEVDWHLPSRFDEGYGLSGQTLDRLADEGCGLVLTVDCGITAVEEVARAKARGLDVVVTDHHRPGDELPDCPIVATRPSEYPFPELCGTGVVAKLAEALGVPMAEHQDLVGLATIADVVPLVDENRAFALAGLRALARTQKPGLRALMPLRVDPAAVDGRGRVSARAAHQRRRADGPSAGGAQLLLATTSTRGSSRAPRGQPRAPGGRTILRSAVAQIESWPENKRRRHGYALADADWHEGVIGIVASRLVERYHRPVVLIAGGEDPWKGSGRSVGAFDLHEALSACSDHLLRWGGHRAAAGLSIDPSEVDAFARAFASTPTGSCPSRLAPVASSRDRAARSAADARPSAGLAQLAPFGLGNPGVTLLAPSCELRDLGGRRRQAPQVSGARRERRRRRQRDRVRARVAPRPPASRGRFDVLFRLEENRWNGTVAPQLVVRRVFDSEDRYEELAAWLRAQWKLEARDPAAQEVFDELQLEDGVKRSLLESEGFRALLAEPAALPAAA